MKTFIKEFILNRKEVGSLVPSSSFLTTQMINNIDFKKSNIIVELGAGTGSFTDKILENLNSKTKLIIFETNIKFCNLLILKYSNNKNVFIINDSAENLEKCLNLIDIYQVDYIISGLPFLNFSKSLRKSIFRSIQRIVLKEFILFQYTSLLEKEILNYFLISTKKRVFFNIPPAIVYVTKISDLPTYINFHQNN